MPTDYKNYPPDWKTRIRPDILQRANNKCEFCGVPNGKVIFRGKWKGENVYQDWEGQIFRESDSELLETTWECVEVELNLKAIKVVLTIAHLDHDTQNNDYSNLKALCQQCYNRHDVEYRKANRKKKRDASKGLIDLFAMYGSREQSEANIKQFIKDLDKKYNYEFVKVDDDSMHTYNVWNERINYEIKMPAIPLEKVRYLGAKGQNIFSFEKIYINGEETHWKYAVTLCNDYFNE